MTLFKAPASAATTPTHQTAGEVENSVAGGVEVVAGDLAEDRHGVAVVESATQAEED